MATTNLSKYNTDAIPNGEKLKIAIVVSQWNTEITAGLKKGAKETLLQHGVLPENILEVEVPGAMELVFGCKRVLQRNTVDAVIALGSVIRGETEHFTFVCQSTSDGIKDLNLTYDIPTIFGVLTDNTLQQSIDRSGGKYGNKGVECAVVALQMAKLKREL